MAKKKGLGRNLDALLGGISPNKPIMPATDAVGPMVATTVEKVQSPHKLPVDLLQPGKYQPRTDMNQEALQELADSINAHGVIQPIAVRLISQGRYEIIAGERRWRAAQLAGLHDVPVIAHDFSDEEASAVALVENLQREDLNPIEEAIGLQRLIDEFDLTHQQLADTLGRARASVTNALRLLSLHSDVRKYVEHGDFDMGHARALLALSTDKQCEAAKRIVNQGLSVRETEKLVKEFLNPAAPKQANRLQDPNVRQLQDNLSDKLAASVQIQHGNRGKGKVIINYNSLDELDGIIAHIK